VLEGSAGEADFGTLLYGSGEGGGVLNHWFARYDEARRFLDDLPAAGPRRYLLAYKRDVFVADREFVNCLGLEPDDPDWEAIAWDWVRPSNLAARRRLYSKRLAALGGPR
jgi:hypothetical protein